MSLTKVASDGIEALAITNAHLHTAANIAHSKLADSGASAGSYGSSTAIPSITVNAKGTITSVSQTSIDTDLLADTTPQLGGSLDVNDFNILNGTAILDITENQRFEFNIGGTEYLDINNTGITVTGNIGVSGTVDGRDLATDGSKLDGIESNATADQSASEILTLLKTVDGAGSGLDADTLDGISSASFVRSDANDSIAATLTVQKIVPVNDSQFDIGANGTRFANGYFDTLYGDGSNLTNLPSQTDNNFTNALLSKLNGIAASATNVTNNNQLTNGAGYITSASLAGVSDGGNAALLDGIDSTSFCRSDQDDTLTGIISLESNGQYPLKIDGNHNGKIVLKGSSNPYIRWQEGTTDKAFIQWSESGYLWLQNQEDNSVIVLRDNLGFSPDGGSTIHKIFHAGNDGSGSGLDADTLDGVQGSSYARSDANDTLSGIITLSNSSRDALNFSANSTDDNRGVAFNGRIALSADYNDGYLRINNASEFSNGVYTPLVMRADGGFNVDGTEVINGSGQLIASRLTGALPAIDGSNLTGVGGGVESGTVMLFYQANAPTGWTKQTSQNNKALRVVSGTGGGTGGSNNFTTAFNSSRSTSGGSVSNHTLTTAQIPSHRHKVDTYNEFGNQFGNWTTQGGYRQAHANGTRRPPYTSYEGSGNAHNHGFSNPSLNLNVQYIDVIIAQKD